MSNSKQTATSTRNERQDVSPATAMVAIFTGAIIGLMLNIAIDAHSKQPVTPTKIDHYSHSAPSHSSATNEGYNP